MSKVAAAIRAREQRKIHPQPEKPPKRPSKQKDVGLGVVPRSAANSQPESTDLRAEPAAMVEPAEPPSG